MIIFPRKEDFCMYAITSIKHITKEDGSVLGKKGEQRPISHILFQKLILNRTVL
jgi:hypothetical protein